MKKFYTHQLLIFSFITALLSCKGDTADPYPCWECTVFVRYSTDSPNGLGSLKDYQTTERTCEDTRKETLHKGYSKTDKIGAYSLTTSTQGLCKPAK